MNRAKDIFKERSRVVTPTDSQVVIECLKFYVKSGTPKKTTKKR
jgi:hypothetical protein